ncbi:hypothetical protein N8550_01635 [Pirellulaceae bacterium]|jgi:hypothetical protein|nr:hypothetical protein [Pirellulaceae bacterium]MDB4640359.1 hypothetical protein [Pirellulaceae bacterium]
MNEKGHQAEEGGSGLNLRLVILGAVLLLFVVAAVWEFVFVRSAYEKSLATIDEIYNDANEPPKTRASVLSKLTGKTPKSDFESKEVSLQGEKKKRHVRRDIYSYVGLIPSQAKREFTVTYERVMDFGETVDNPETFADDQWDFKYYFEAGNEPEETKPTGGSSVAATGPKTKLERIFMTALVDDFDGTVSVDKLDGKSSILKNLKWFDPDESGSITLEEFNAGVKMFEEANGKMSEDDIYDMVGGKSPGEGAPNGAGGQESSSN